MKEYPPGKELIISDFTSFVGDGRARLVLAFINYLWRSLYISVRYRPDAVVAVGTPEALPFFLWARLSGKKAVFIESITRVDSLSRTSRMLARLRLCHKIYVQWPCLAKTNPNTEYHGVVI